MPEDEYHAAAGLSCSGMKQLSVSPLNYWHQNLNPEFVQPEETYPQRIGKALHARLLEGDTFADRYAAAATPDDFPGCLVTVDDMKAWLAENGLPVSAKRKQELIDRIAAVEGHPPVWDLELWGLAEVNAGKVLLKKPEMALLEKAARVVAADPFATAALSGGVAEVSFFVNDPESGVLLKARMDYVKPNATIDLKTFSNSRGKPTDKAVFDAIFYESYYLQCVVYQRIRELGRQQLVAGEIAVHGAVSEEWLKGFTAEDSPGFGFVFVESDEPFDMRITQLVRSEAPGAGANVYWSAAEMKMTDLTQIYVECVEKYGNDPWREPCRPRVLADTDMPQLMFA